MLSVMSKPKYRRNLLSPAVLFVLLWVAQAASAASFMPLIHNYGKADYNAALQNWDLTQNDGGEILIGNGNGVLCFDGYNWRLTRLPGNAVARSVLAVGDRVYVGAYKDFGYLVRDAYGDYVYTSLWPKNYKPHEDEIWNIVVDKRGTVYFQSFSAWFSYDGKTVTPHYDQAMMPLYFHEVNGEIYMQAQMGHYYHLQGGKMVKIIDRTAVGNDHVVAALPGPGGGLTLCTQWHGLFSYSGGKVTPIVTAADAALKTANANRATLVSGDSTVVVGTILDGIFGIGRNGDVKWHYSMSNRLNVNSVLGLMCDRDGNVWAALDIGLALISTASPFSLLTPDLAASSIGMVYGLNDWGNYLFIATNQAAWQYDWKTGLIRRIAGSDGQNWHVTQVDNQLLLGNNDGTKSINPATATASPLIGPKMGSTSMRKCMIGGQEILLESSYYDMRVSRKVNGVWTFSHTLDAPQAPISQFEVDPAGNIWASHMSHGLFRIRLSHDLMHAKAQIVTTLGGDTVKSFTHVMKIRGRVVFSTDRSLYTYDDRLDSIIPFNELDGMYSGMLCDITAVNDSDFWLSTSEGFALVSYDGKRYRLKDEVSSLFFGLECNDNKNSVYAHDGVAYFYLNNGIGRLLPRQSKPAHAKPHPLRVREALTQGSNGNTQRMPIVTSKSHRAKAMPHIELLLSYPNYDFKQLTFVYRLKYGGKELVSQSQQPFVEYNALGYGDYQLTITVNKLDGTTLDTAEYFFKRERQFYASLWAWLIYVSLMALAVYGLVRYRTKKTEARLRKQFEDKKLQQDIAMLEQSKVIAEQKQLLLEAQLNDKAREAASLALDAVARNRAIENIRATLQEKRRKGTISQHDMAAMLSQLGENADGENFWEVYQNNFNLIHHNFFKKLQQAYPALTPADLRFCALLRLNLSTKDIAQFTGLSVRGVESARYRLRRKFNLDEGQNLVDFLIHFE